MVRRLLPLLLSAALTGIAHAAATYKGVVLANDEGGAPQDRVSISADGANHTETHDGRFVLVFPNKRPGESARIVIDKPGYVVVNTYLLRVTLPLNSDAEEPVFIICKEAEVDHWRTSFFHIKLQRGVEATYQERLKALSAEDRQNQALLEQLRRERDQARTQAEQLAAELAHIRPEDATELYANAMRLFLRDDIRGALALLDAQKLRQSFGNAQRLKTQAEREEARALQAFLLRAQLLELDYKFDQAVSAYQEIISLAPDNYEACFELGNLWQSLERPQKAEVFLRQSVKIARDRSAKEPQFKLNLAASLNNVANAIEANVGALFETDQEAYFKRRQEAVDDYKESLSIYKSLEAQNPAECLPNEAMILINLSSQEGGVNQQTRVNELTEAIQMFRKLAMSEANKYLPRLAYALASLANIGNPAGLTPRGDSEELRHSRALYEESLKTFGSVDNLSPEDRALEAATWSNFGLLNWNAKKPEESWKSYQRSLRIFQDLASKNPDGYLPDVARSQHAMALLAMQDLRDKDREVQALQGELAALTKLSDQDNPGTIRNIEWTKRMLSRAQSADKANSKP